MRQWYVSYCHKTPPSCLRAWVSVHHSALGTVRLAQCLCRGHASSATRRIPVELNALLLCAAEDFVGSFRLGSPTGVAAPNPGGEGIGSKLLHSVAQLPCCAIVSAPVLPYSAWAHVHNGSNSILDTAPSVTILEGRFTLNQPQTFKLSSTANTSLLHLIQATESAVLPVWTPPLYIGLVLTVLFSVVLPLLKTGWHLRSNFVACCLPCVSPPTTSAFFLLYPSYLCEMWPPYFLPLGGN